MEAHDDKILKALEKFVYDPLGFVYFAYPWQQAGTILEHEEGPDDWQTQKLKEIGDAMKGSSDPVNFAIRSGHGIGKTTFLAWVQHWFISTRPHCQIVVTANTKPQLETKTWRELAKWHRLSIHAHWFKYTATKFYFTEFKDTWFSACIPWSKERSEAFAGTHEKHVLLIFDEASYRGRDLGSRRGRDDHARGALGGRGKPDTKHRALFRVLEKVQASLDPV
jgi:hypothetical protein